jgi:hypothetical protein
MSWVVGLSNNSYKPITNTAWVRARRCKLQKGCTRLAVACDKVYQLLAHGRWFSPGTPASSTTKTGRHEIAEILLKVALNTKNQNQSIKSIRCTFCEISIEFYSTSTEAPFGQLICFEKTIITNNYFYYYDIALRSLINSP